MSAPDMRGYYFHSMFQACIPVRILSQPDGRGWQRIQLPDGHTRRVKAGVVSAQPVDGFPIRKS